MWLIAAAGLHTMALAVSDHLVDLLRFMPSKNIPL